MGCAVVTDVDTPRQLAVPIRRSAYACNFWPIRGFIGKEQRAKPPLFSLQRSPRPCIEESRK